MNRYKMYDDIYGDIPENYEDRIKFILENTRNAEEVVKLADKIKNKINKIKKKNVKFTVYIEPKPSARPRITTLGAYPRFYVPNARMNKTNFQSFFKQHDLPFIETPMQYNIDVFMKTPSSFNKIQKLLAEIGIIRPWGRSGDIDNLFKAYTDWCIDSLIKDDSLIVDAVIRKYYSIKPRLEFDITYLETFPEVDIKMPTKSTIKTRR